MTSVSIMDAFPKGQPSQRLNKESIGAWFMFDSLATKVSDLYVRPLGQLLSRSEYPELWEWIQKSREASTLLSDTSWLAVQTTSPNGAVSNYSNGDGVSTFRVPSTGNTADGSGVFFRDKGSITDPVLLNVGKQDQIVNIHGTVSGGTATGGLDIFRDVVGAFTLEELSTYGALDNVTIYPATGRGSKAVFNAANQVKTGDQVQPNNMLMSYYIYTGKGTASYSPLPDVYDELQRLTNIALEAASPNVLMNTNPDKRLNQRAAAGFAATPVGAYVYDRWVKESGTTIGQVIEEGFYKPNTTYTVCVSGVRKSAVVSPASGHWHIIIPVDWLDYVDFYAGVEERNYYYDHVADIDKCFRYYQKMKDIIFGDAKAGVADAWGGIMETITYSNMRIIPSVHWGVLQADPATGVSLIFEASSNAVRVASSGGGGATVYQRGDLSLDAEIPAGLAGTTTDFTDD